MDGMTVSVVTYIIAVIISFFVAGLIQVMSSILTHFTKDASPVETVMADSPSENTLSDDAAVAAAIVITRENN